MLIGPDGRMFSRATINRITLAFYGETSTMSLRLLSFLFFMCIVSQPLSAQLRQQLATGVLIHRAEDTMIRTPRTPTCGKLYVSEYLPEQPEFSTTLAPYLRYSIVIMTLMDETLELSSGFGLAVHKTRFTNSSVNNFGVLKQVWITPTADMLFGARFQTNRLGLSLGYGVSLYTRHYWKLDNVRRAATGWSGSGRCRPGYSDQLAFRTDYRLMEFGENTLQIQAGVENLNEILHTPVKLSFGLLVKR